jgi:hypothetical protein
MKTRPVPTSFILLVIGLTASTAWSSQHTPAASPTAVHAGGQDETTAKQKNKAGATKEALPSILNEEEIPAFLRMDPCDTGDA